eukprot:scaffold27507_cov19-Tisochrysis_lutea.AAC.1
MWSVFSTAKSGACDSMRQEHSKLCSPVNLRVLMLSTWKGVNTPRMLSESRCNLLASTPWIYSCQYATASRSAHAALVISKPIHGCNDIPTFVACTAKQHLASLSH